MAKILYITANPKPENEAFSLRLGKAFLEKVKEISPEDEIIELDLYKADIPFLDEDVFSGWGKLAQNQSLTPKKNKKSTGSTNWLTNLWMRTSMCLSPRCGTCPSHRA